MNTRRKFLTTLLGSFFTVFLYKCKNLVDKSHGQTSLDTEGKHIAYCCLTCDESCKAFRATKYNDMKLKAEIAKKKSEKHNKYYSPESIACYGCKDERQPQNDKSRCTVRKCAIEKGVENCARCTELKKCNDPLWKGWPELKKNALRMQKELKV